MQTWFLKFCHFIGLTNLSDEEVAKYAALQSHASTTEAMTAEVEFHSVGSFFLRQGIGSVLEILVPVRRYLPEKANAEAIQKDWETVGSDLLAASLRGTNELLENN